MSYSEPLCPPPLHSRHNVADKFATHLHENFPECVVDDGKKETRYLSLDKITDKLALQLQNARMSDGCYTLNYPLPFELMHTWRLMLSLEGIDAKLQPAIFHRTIMQLSISTHQRTACFLDSGEMAYLRKVFLEVPQPKDGINGYLLDIPPSEDANLGNRSPTSEANIEVTEADISHYRRQTFDNGLWVDFGGGLLTTSAVLKLAEILVTDLEEAKNYHCEYILTRHSGVILLFAISLILKHGGNALVKPAQDPMHPQVTAINKAIRLVLEGQYDHEKDSSIQLDTDEVVSMSKILDELSVTTKNIDLMEKHPTSRFIEVKDRVSAAGRYGYTPRQGAELIKSEIEMVISCVEQIFREHFPNHKKETPVSSNLGTRLVQTNEMLTTLDGAMKSKATIYSETIVTLKRDHQAEIYELKRAHNSIVKRHNAAIANVKELQLQQVQEAKTEHKLNLDKVKKRNLEREAAADTRCNAIREDLRLCKAKHMSTSEELAAERQTYEDDIKKRDLEFKSFKNEGKAFLIKNQEQTKKWKKMFDDLVSANIVRDLDHEALLEMFKTTEAENEKAAKIHKADKLYITELEVERGVLRSQRGIPAFDQRAADQISQLAQQNSSLREENDTLRKDKTILTQQKVVWLEEKEQLNKEVSSLRKEVQGFKENIAITNSIHETTVATLEKERAKPTVIENSVDREALIRKNVEFLAGLEAEKAKNQKLQEEYAQLTAQLDDLVILQDELHKKWRALDGVRKY